MRERYGRKMLHGVMKAKGINADETKIGKILCEINPEAERKRKNVAGHSLNLKVYNVEYFGHKIHYNQNEKLGMFGVVHVCARDRFLGKIVEHATMARKKNLVIYEEIYRLMITFSIFKNDVFQISQIFEVFYSLFRSSLLYNKENSQLIFCKYTSFYQKLFPSIL